MMIFYFYLVCFSFSISYSMLSFHLVYLFQFFHLFFVVLFFKSFSLVQFSSVHLVRNVGPNKEMLCITFWIPAAILYKNQTVNQENHEDPPLKRQRTDKDV